jgi:HlyD family secretion protein
VSNGIISFDIQLNDKSSNGFTPKSESRRILNYRYSQWRFTYGQWGSAFNGSNLQDVFVIRNGIAERRTVKTGLSNFDYIEIVSGLKSGR